MPSRAAVPLAPLGAVFLGACLVFRPAEVPPPSDEPTRLEQTIAAAIMARDSVTLGRFIAPGFTLLNANLSDPPITREAWLGRALKEFSIDSIAVRDVTGRWAGDTLFTEFWLYYRGKHGEQPVAAEESRMRDTWLLDAARWQLLSRRTLESRPVAVPEGQAVR
jgi:hypothetical protein